MSGAGPADRYAGNVEVDTEQLARDVDAEISALTGGPANQTVSVRVALAARRGEKWACWFCAVLSVLVQRGHCAAVLTPAPLPWWVYFRAALAFALAFALALASVQLAIRILP